MTKAQYGSYHLSAPLINLITILMGVMAAYFLTIQSLKIEMGAKAEGTVVGRLDKKLANIEVILKESVVSKDQFYVFSRDVETRLTRIEAYLADKSGDEIGKR